MLRFQMKYKNGEQTREEMNKKKTRPDTRQQPVLVLRVALLTSATVQSLGSSKVCSWWVSDRQHPRTVQTLHKVTPTVRSVASSSVEPSLACRVWGGVSYFLFCKTSCQKQPAHITSDIFLSYSHGCPSWSISTVLSLSTMPPIPKYPCGTCSKSAATNSLLCIFCDMWHHTTVLSFVLC